MARGHRFPAPRAPRWDCTRMIDHHPQNQLGQLILSRPLDLIYAPVPKAACTTIKSILRAAEGLPPLADPMAIHDPRRNGLTYLARLPFEEAAALLMARKGGPRRLLVVRDPAARALSAWRDKVATRSQSAQIEGVLVRELGWGAQRLARGIGAADFLRALRRIPAQRMNRHWMPQWALGCLDLVRWSDVVKVEEMAGSAALGALLGVDPATLPRLNATPGPAATPDAETASLIATVYGRDLRAFGYAPPAGADPAGGD